MSSLTSWLAARDRRAVALVIGLVVILIAGGGATAAYAYQASRPVTATLNISDNAREVALDRAVAVTLSRASSPAALAQHVQVAPAVDGQLEPRGDRAVRFTPSRWADLTLYTVTLTPYTDPAGHHVDGARWRFTTTILPRVTGVTLDGGAAAAADAEIPVGSVLNIAFNTAMDTTATTFAANGNSKDGPVTWAADGKSAAFNTKGRSVGPLTLTFTGRDQAGHPADASWKLPLTLVYRISVHTTPLKFPALVQVPNDPTARDQSGLQAADMVYEYVTEGGITRFTAIFTNVPDKVGPVRSGRLISLRLTRHYRGMLFLSGTSEGTFGVLNRDPVPTFFDTQGFFYRSSDRLAPNNLYINGDAIKRAEDGGGPPASSLPRTGRPGLTGGTAQDTVAVPEHSSSYHYDAATGTYSKTEDGHPYSDASIAQPLRIAMLVVMHMPVSVTSIIEDSNGARGLDYNTEAGGSAEVYWNGQKFPANWSSADRSSPFVFTVNGQTLTLPAGLVWVDVVP